MATHGITVDSVTKRYPGVVALDDVSLVLPRGKAVGLVGENGAGKSTLTKILAGHIAVGTYDGEVWLDEELLQFGGPADASDKGIAQIPQELSLHPDLSIAENVMLGRWPTTRRRVDWKTLRSQAQAVVQRIGLNRDVTAAVSGLSPSEQQLVAIARALARGPRVLLLDEPTAALDTAEVKRLLRVVRTLRDEGVTLLYVSHRLGEIFDVCDRVVVLRDGKVACDDDITNLDRRTVVTAMLGSESAAVEDRKAPEPRTQGQPALEVSMSLPDPAKPSGFVLKDIEFSVHRGEVVGLVGLVGSGRTETLWSIYGALPRLGSVRVGGVSLPADPAVSVHSGLGLVTEERRSTGLFPLGTVATNVVAASYRNLTRQLGWIPRRHEDSATTRVIDDLRIKVNSPRVPIMALSGGNQQKALLGRWMMRDTQVLLLDEPARGIDVGAKAEMYSLLRQLATKDNMAILTTSSDVSELVGVCDRFLVLHEGRLVAEVDAADAAEAGLLELAGSVTERAS